MEYIPTTDRSVKLCTIQKPTTQVWNCHITPFPTIAPVAQMWL